LRALRETKNFQEVGNSRLPMLMFSPIIKEGRVLLELTPLPYSLFLNPYLLFK
jgi:hypothetical protein